MRRRLAAPMTTPRAAPGTWAAGGTRLREQQEARRCVWLGPAELAAVDALIASGIATSRGDAIRWSVSRTRENRVTYDRT
jgi:hypothetical protein